MLSENFHPAEFTDQEVGIAISLGTPIFPIGINRTKPYGFFKQYQVKQISEITADTMKEAYTEIRDHWKQSRKIVDFTISQLEKSSTPLMANMYGRVLYEHKKFTQDQIDKLAQAFIFNLHVREEFSPKSTILTILCDNIEMISQMHISNTILKKGLNEICPKK